MTLHGVRKRSENWPSWLVFVISLHRDHHVKIAMRDRASRATRCNRLCRIQQCRCLVCACLGCEGRTVCGPCTVGFVFQRRHHCGLASTHTRRPEHIESAWIHRADDIRDTRSCVSTFLLDRVRYVRTRSDSQSFAWMDGVR